jgi:hypothetical protein
MSGRIGWAAIVVAGVAAASCAPTTPGGGVQAERTASGAVRQCFTANNVNGFSRVDSQTVDLKVGARRVFRVGLLGTCPEVSDAVAIGVRTRSGSSYVCEDNDVDLIVPGSIGGPRRCPATSLREISRAELEAERAARRR